MNVSIAAAKPISNSIYLRRRTRIVVSVAVESEPLSAVPAPNKPAVSGSLQLVATALKNLEALGYGVSDELLAGLLELPPVPFLSLYNDIITTLTTLRGADHAFEPMYPNFPDQVMEMSEVRLYLNALVHYWSQGRLLPHTEKAERPALSEDTRRTEIGLGSADEFAAIFTQIAAANTALSAQDREDAAWFVQTFGDDIAALLPASIPNKENAATIARLLLRHISHNRSRELVGTFTRTATDVLRLAVALSGGDVSLAGPTKFITFPRPERVLLLDLLNRLPFESAVEDMLRWKGRWLRLGERLHPGEYARQYPNAARAFGVLRNSEPFVTFNGAVERALGNRNVAEALSALIARPGDLARRLDHLLRLAVGDARDAVTAAFAAAAAEKVSTPVLLQVRQHFVNRSTELSGADMPLRVFFPKGSIAKAFSIENTLPTLPELVCGHVVAACESALTARFAALPGLGKTYLDPALRDFMIPFALRSASKSLRTLVRGSRLPLPAESNILRFFVWWTNGDDRTDIDLSAALYDDQFGYVDVLSYYNLKNFGGVHSGDIVDAPEGASEFIDVARDSLLEQGIRYVVMSLNCYTHQPFASLPECFAGWMAREEPGSGEVFEPRTVQDRLDLTADTVISLPLVIDVTANQVIWCDIALRRDPRWANDVAGNAGGIGATLRSLVHTGKPNLYDLFRLHAEARGIMVESAVDADTVFSVESGTPYRLEEIASTYMT